MKVRMKVKLEFIDGTVETYYADEINILTESFAGEHTLEREINQALIRGGIFEVSPPLGFSLIKKIKINSHTVKKATLIRIE